MAPKCGYLVVFVCSGNTCRSPMAEAFFRDMLSGSRLEERVEVTSAGVRALPGSEPSSQAVEVVSEVGGELCGHSSRSFDRELLKRADLVLTMTVQHRREVERMLAEGGDAPEIYTLKELARSVPGSGSGSEETGGRKAAESEDYPRRPGSEARNLNIADPFGGSLDRYRACAREIHNALRAVKRELERRLEEC